MTTGRINQVAFEFGKKRSFSKEKARGLFVFSNIRFQLLPKSGVGFPLRVVLPNAARVQRTIFSPSSQFYSSLSDGRRRFSKCFFWERENNRFAQARCRCRVNCLLFFVCMKNKLDKEPSFHCALVRWLRLAVTAILANYFKVAFLGDRL